MPLAGELASFMGVLAALGGACLGHAAPLWSRARAAKRQRTREWQHALEVLRLREQQAEDDPALSVEVLERVERQPRRPVSKWNEPMPGKTGHVH